jgi:hypothetical protein
VFLSTLEKERFTAVAEGVVAISAEGFRVGNIIFDVIARNRDEIVSRDVAELYDLQEGLAGESQSAQLLGEARQDGLILLAITPSYGASGLILAKSIDLGTK